MTTRTKVQPTKNDQDSPSRDELVAKILEAVRSIDTMGIVNLGHHAFDRIPCSRRTIYALARKHASDWGYVYDKAEYVPSGNRAFQRNHKRGQHVSPMLRRVNH